MQPENVQEYLEIRKEQMDLRNCVNIYVGFVVAGAGPALFGLIDKSESKTRTCLFAVFAALLIAMVLLLLVYKFRSHNRYAGYGKLLLHERFQSDDAEHHDFFAWEICLDLLRRREGGDSTLADPLLPEHFRCKTQFDQAKGRLEKLSGKKPEADSGAWYKGAKVLIGFYRDHNSWGFPPYVARVLAIESVLFLAVPICLFGNRPANIHAALHSHGWSIGVASIGLLATCGIWWFCLSLLYKLMEGSLTVNAHHWLFVPTRVYLINEVFGANHQYTLVGEPNDEDNAPKPEAPRASVADFPHATEGKTKS